MHKDLDESSSHEVGGFFFLNRTVQRTGLQTTFGTEYIHNGHLKRMWWKSQSFRKLQQLRQQQAGLRASLYSSLQESKYVKIIFAVALNLLKQAFKTSTSSKLIIFGNKSLGMLHTNDWKQDNVTTSRLRKQVTILSDVVTGITRCWSPQRPGWLGWACGGWISTLVPSGHGQPHWFTSVCTAGVTTFYPSNNSVFETRCLREQGVWASCGP